MHWRQFITKGNNTSCLTIGAKQCCLHTEEIKYFHLLLGLENQVTLFWLYLTFLWLICYLIRLRCLGNNPRFIYLVSKSKYGAMWVKPYIHVLQRNLTYLCYSETLHTCVTAVSAPRLAALLSFNHHISATLACGECAPYPTNKAIVWGLKSAIKPAIQKPPPKSQSLWIIWGLRLSGMWFAARDESNSIIFLCFLSGIGQRYCIDAMVKT